MRRTSFVDDGPDSSRYDPRMRIALVALLLFASCTRHVVRVRPSELADHASELVSRGEATVLGAKAYRCGSLPASKSTSDSATAILNVRRTS